MIWALVAAAGLFSGFVGGLLGVGGGILLVPLFLELFSAMHQVAHPTQTAFGTSHVVILLTSLAAVRAQSRHGGTDWEAVQRMGAGVLAGALLGGYAAALLSGRLLQYLFAGFVTAMALRTVRAARSDPPPARARKPGTIATFSAACGIGGFASFFGVGGGILAVPYLLRFHGKPIHEAMATSSGLLVVTASASLAAYAWNGRHIGGASPLLVGYVHLGVGLAAGAAAVLGAWYGVKAARKTSRRKLLYFFAALLVAVAGRLVMRGG